MKLIAMLTDPKSIEALTSALDEQADPLAPQQARPPPEPSDEQLELWLPEDENQLSWC